MQKISKIFLICLFAASLMAGCTAGAEQRTGEAQGYGGVLRVTVRMNGSDITEVKVVEHAETQGVGTRAIDTLPEAIVRADSPEVDSVSGATVTSRAIMEAVRQAVGGDLSQKIDMNAEAKPAPSIAGGMKSGVGMAANGRFLTIGEENIPALNIVFAAASFDAQGRILDVNIDQLELFGPQMAEGNRFEGFPDNDGTQENFLQAARTWVSKGAMGEDYQLPGGTWRQQMDAYQRQMVGKTVAEVHAWHEETFDQTTRRPKANGTDGADSTDGMTGATISLTGEYGEILLALDRAWEDAQGDATSTEEGATSTGVPSSTGTPEDAAPSVSPEVESGPVGKL